MTKSISDRPPLGQPPLKRPKLDRQAISVEVPQEIILLIFKNLSVYDFYCQFKNLVLVSKAWGYATHLQISERSILENLWSKSIPNDSRDKVFEKVVSKSIRAKVNVIEKKQLRKECLSKIRFEEYLIERNGENLIIYNILSDGEPKIIKCEENICLLYIRDDSIFCYLKNNKIVIYSILGLNVIHELDCKSNMVKILADQEFLIAIYSDLSVEAYDRNNNYQNVKFINDLHLDSEKSIIAFFQKTLYWLKENMWQGESWLYYQSLDSELKYLQTPEKCISNICIVDNFYYYIKKYSDDKREDNSFCIGKFGGPAEEIEHKSFSITGMAEVCQLLVIKGLFAVVARSFRITPNQSIYSLEIYDLVTQKCVHTIDMKDFCTAGNLFFSAGKIFCITENPKNNYLNTLCISFEPEHSEFFDQSFGKKGNPR